MNYIVDFYKGLDAINLIIFWGTIIVVLLLLFFSIIMVNKNKKLRHIIESRGIDIDNYNDYDEELAIKNDIDNEKIIIKETLKKENMITNNQNIDIEIPIVNKDEVESKFTPEELVMEYNKNEVLKNNNKELENIKYVDITEKNDSTNEKINSVTLEENKNNNYQENIEKTKEIIKKELLRKTENNDNHKEVQISPIDISKRKNDYLEEINKAKELQENLHYQEKNEEYQNNIRISSVDRQKQIADEIKKQVNNEEKPRGNYLEEISKSLSKITNNDDLYRTAYELKQEEDAIISYKELMEKKDTIKTIDEEEAVISMEELLAKKQQEEKIYNLTNDAEDDKFINELKNFRSDL